ncbi:MULTISPECIES: hypothetical protein [unclassified Streptomyces]|uniref:hypothetical protein n=1 Tax=unclassified Streptomyces TaxID=2593676 RepID=UPI000B89263D|nr:MULTISPECIES: hypothetical protein [unclassified Streptomyces]
MSQDPEEPEVHHNVFFGPAVFGGTQNVLGATFASVPSRPSIPSQIWAAIMLAWAFCPMVAWCAQSVLDQELFSRLTGSDHDIVLYIWLAGGVALLLDVAGYLLYRHWAVAQRAINNAVTWKLRLGAVALGGAALAISTFMTSR